MRALIASATRGVGIATRRGSVVVDMPTERISGPCCGRLDQRVRRCAPVVGWFVDRGSVRGVGQPDIIRDMTALTVNTPPHLEHRVPTPDGRTLAVAEWGDPDGLPFIAMHGTPGSRISYWQDPTVYARHGLRRLTYDRPGYGDSTRLPGRSIADVIPDVITIAEALGFDRF